MLELLLGMFIISLLAMVALPAFQNYRIRAQVARDFALVHIAKTAIQEYYAVNLKLPTSNQQVGLDEYFTVKDGKAEGTLCID